MWTPNARNKTKVFSEESFPTCMMKLEVNYFKMSKNQVGNLQTELRNGKPGVLSINFDKRSPVKLDGIA